MKNDVRHFDYVYPPLRQELAEAVSRSYLFDMEDRDVMCYQNGYILPAKYIDGYNAVGGCMDANGSFIWDCAVPDFMGYPYEFETVDAEVEDVCIYVGYMYNCYGHMIGDCLRWAWFAQTRKCKDLLHKGAKFVCISIDKLASYQIELLKLAGIDNVVCIERPTQVKHLYIPHPSIITKDGQNYYSACFDDTINLMIHNAYAICHKSFYDKVYLTRSRWKKGDVSNERQIERFFSCKGYKIISPERMSIAEQIVLLNNASSVAATECSLSHQMIFCQPMAECYILRKNLHINKYSLFINQMRQLKVIYIDCSLSLLVPNDAWWSGPFFIYLNDNLSRCFEEGFSTHTQLRLPKKEFAKYLMLSFFETSNIAHRLKNVSPIYADLLQNEISRCPKNSLKSRLRKCRIFSKIYKRMKSDAKSRISSHINCNPRL